MKTIALALAATMICAVAAGAAEYASPHVYHPSKAEKAALAAKAANGQWMTTFWETRTLNGN